MSVIQTQNNLSWLPQPNTVVITATTEPTVTPGTYRGVVQVGGAEAVWMPLEIVVEDLPA